MPKRKNKDDNEEDDEQYRDRENKWEGFHFTRLTCISILTLIIMIVALILDSLSVWGKERECTWSECASGACTGCGGQGSDGLYRHYPKCQGNGQCGWRWGTTKWIQPSPASPGCPVCSDATYCISGSLEISTPAPASAPSYVGQVNNWESEYNFADLCNDHDDDEACMAMDGGNVYLAFTIFAIIFNLFTLCIIAPLYCRDTSIFPCDVCDEKTHIFLGILYGLMFFCNLIPVVVWLGAADGGMCDNADPNHDGAFANDTINFPGYSLGGLMICIIADIVACGAVCCCWGDNRHYGDDRDTAKIDRQREKEMYRQQEQEMQQQPMQQQQQQQQPPQQQQQQQPQYNQPPQQQQQQQQQYNQAPPQQQQQQYNQQQPQYGGQPQYGQQQQPQYNNNPNQYGGGPPNTTYSYN